jgi:hypothetical protein
LLRSCRPQGLPNTYCDSIFNEKAKEDRATKEISTNNRQAVVDNIWENYLIFSAMITIAGLIAIVVISNEATPTATTAH